MTNQKAAGLSYLDVGKSDKVIVFIHGFPLDHSMWRCQWGPMSESYRVLAPDLRGFGDSDSVDDQPLTMAQHADDLVSWLTSIGVDGSVAFAGLSMGGYVVWELLRRHPERVCGAALLDSKVVADTDEARAGREAAATKALKEGVESLAVGMLPKLVGRAASDDVRSALLQMMRATSPKTIAAALRGMAARQAATDLLPTLNVPCLVLGGSEDVISPPDEMRAFAEQIPGAVYVEVADAGHMAPWENPEATNEAMFAWLDRLTWGPSR